MKNENRNVVFSEPEASDAYFGVDMSILPENLIFHEIKVGIRLKSDQCNLEDGCRLEM